jgi:hypothetical protein
MLLSCGRPSRLEVTKIALEGLLEIYYQLHIQNIALSVVDWDNNLCYWHIRSFHWGI